MHAEEEVLGLGVRQERQSLEPLLGREDRPGVVQLLAAEDALARSLFGRGRHDAGVTSSCPPTGRDGSHVRVGGVLRDVRTALAVAAHIPVVPSATGTRRPGARRAITAGNRRYT